VSFADAGTLDDPLVIGSDQFFEVLIRHEPRGNITAERSDFRLGQNDFP
jgi:hypothetical protein